MIGTLGKNKAFATKEARQDPADKMSTTDINMQGGEEMSRADITLRKRQENTEKASEFGGKRFLGLTPKGKEVYVKYRLTKDDMKLSIWFTHKPSILLKEGSKLANNRYDCGLYENLKNSPELMTRKLQKPHSQEVKKQTLHWLKRLELLTEMNYVDAFVKGKPTKFMFIKVADIIHSGDFSNESVKPTKHEVMKMWDFPHSSTYFVPETTWSYPDEL